MSNEFVIGLMWHHRRVTPITTMTAGSRRSNFQKGANSSHSRDSSKDSIYKHSKTTAKRNVTTGAASAVDISMDVNENKASDDTVNSRDNSQNSRNRKTVLQ